MPPEAHGQAAASSASAAAATIGPGDAAPGATDSATGVANGSLLLRLDGYEGPLDLLLELARAQKVDLAKLSILALVEQYLAVIEGVLLVRLELAADWLVMAAWLTWLKSRLLLPAGSDETEEAEAAAETLAARLADLQAIRAAAAWLNQRPRLGQDVFARGAPEDLIEQDRSHLSLDLTALVRGYLSASRRAGGRRQYQPPPRPLWSVQDALRRLGAMLHSLPDWTSLEQFLPDRPGATALERRGALASTLLAGLEMARGGAVRLVQEAAFAPILIGRPPEPAGE